MKSEPDEADHLFKTGHVEKAIVLQKQKLRRSPSLEDLLKLARYQFEAGAYEDSEQTYRRALKLAPSHPEINANIGMALTRAGKFEEATAHLLDCEKASPKIPAIQDGLAKCYGQMGDRDKASLHGIRSLDLKHENALRDFVPFEMAARPLKPFDPSEPLRNVISFSLWGEHTQYLHHAIKNAQMARELFPDWRCRFYCEKSTVPDWVVAEMLSYQADVVLMEPQKQLWEGLFWRFLPVSDPEVDRFLVRDADSVLTFREKAAVEEWLASDKRFHLMRDSYTHTDLILAGLWGGVGGVLPELSDRIEAFLDSPAKSKNIDQRFLGANYWPAIHKDAMIHDSWFGNFGARSFPRGTELGKGRHVGGSPSIVAEFAPGRAFQGSVSLKIRPEPARSNFVFSLAPACSGTNFLANLFRLNLKSDAEVHHRRNRSQEIGLHTPDQSHQATFNDSGNVVPIARFWQRKFNAIRYGEVATYAETSHSLCHAGLIENLALLGSKSSIHLIHLKADEEETAWRIEKKISGIDPELRKMLILDIACRRRNVDPRNYVENGTLGIALWYVREVTFRIALYKKSVAPMSNVRVHEVDPYELIDAENAERFFREIFPYRVAEKITLPDLPEYQCFEKPTAEEKAKFAAIDSSAAETPN